MNSVWIAIFVILGEMVAFLLLLPAYCALMPFRVRKAGQTVVQDRMRLRDFKGKGRDAVWRYRSASGTMLFRSPFRLGNPIFAMGRIQLRKKGGYTVHWAPVPMLGLFLLLAVAAMVVTAPGFEEVVELPYLLPGVLAVGGVVIVLQYVASRTYFRRHVLVEVQGALKREAGRSF